MGDEPSSEAKSITILCTGDQLTTESDVDIKDNDGIIPQLFERASCLSHRFQEFIEDLVDKDVRTNIVQSPISSSEGHPGHVSYSGNCSRLSVDNDGASAISVSESSNSVSASERKITNTTAVALPISFSNSALVEATQSFWNTPIFFKGLVARVQTTLRGSANDIGWLLRTPGMPSVEDGTSRFMELLERIRNGEHMLPDTLVYLLVPGLFSNHGPLYFVNTKKVFSKLGLACHIAKIHSEASVETNARELKQYIEELYWGSGKRVMLLGHSKGGVDAAAAMAMYWPDLKDKVAGLALVQSPYGGSPIASDILREGQIADIETRRIMELFICKVIKGDMQALEDLTYEKRREFISKHTLPTDVPLVSFHTEVSIAPGVLATMSHIAHAELPWFPLPGTNSNSEEAASQRTKVPVAVPVPAAMAMCAMHLQLRYGEKSDGLVTRKDAEVPGSVVVRPDRKLDHAWMVYSSLGKDTTDPNASQMCEALLALLVEIGQRKSGSATDKFVK